MFALRTAINYTKKTIWRSPFLIAIVFVMAAASVTACRIGNAGLNNIMVADTIELTCDINISENDETGIYTLTVAGYLRTDDAYTEGIPPVIFRSFDLITDGSIESVENIVLSVHTNKDVEGIQCDVAYAVLEEVDISRHDK